jgi:subtilisin
MLRNSSIPTTRRTVLQSTGGALAALSASGFASAATGDTVRVNVGYSAESGRQAALAAADDVVHDFEFDALTLELQPRAMDALSGRSDVRYVERDGTVEALAQTLPWGIDRVDADVAHANGETGNGADIAIIDTGIDSTHPDLKPNLGEGKAFVASEDDPTWQDDNGHGTHCAGIADAVDNDQGVVGVSTEATLHAVKVLSASGAGLTSDVAKGIEYVGDKQWDVGSLSLGGGDSDVLRDACEYAYHDRGVLLVAAAGNDGPCSNCVGYPAAYDECVAVSATSCDDSLAGFSSTGPEVEIAAPGDDVYSTYIAPRYYTLSGTSMACPHVSGAGAQLMANGYSNTEARQRLRDTAENVGLSDDESGAGLLDVAAALGLDSSDDGTGNGPNC